MGGTVTMGYGYLETSTLKRVVSLILFNVVLVAVQVNGQTWIGSTYWTSRYSSDGISYADRNVYWSDSTNGEKAYGRTNQYGSTCSSCTCATGVLDCSAASVTTL